MLGSLCTTYQATRSGAIGPSLVEGLSCGCLLCFPLPWQSLLRVGPEMKQLFCCARRAGLHRVPLVGDYYITRPFVTGIERSAYLLRSGDVSAEHNEIIHTFRAEQQFGPITDVQAVQAKASARQAKASAWLDSIVDA